MGRKSKSRPSARRPMKGFRPGKEPLHLKKQRARARLGSDATWLQKQTVEAVAGRSRIEVERIVRRWSLGLLAGAVLLGLLGGFLYTLAVVAGVLAHVVTVALLVLAYRVRKQGPTLVQMAESLE
jgi:hypothetical protein